MHRQLGNERRSAALATLAVGRVVAGLMRGFTLSWIVVAAYLLPAKKVRVL